MEKKRGPKPKGIKAMTEGKQICNNCNRDFDCSKELFESHLLTHRYLMPYACGVSGCNAFFQHKEEWKEHVEEHKKSYEFFCEECGLRFKYESNKPIDIIPSDLFS